MWAFQKLILDKVQDATVLDGSWQISPLAWWGDPAPLWALFAELANEYRPGEAQSLTHDWGTSYTSSFSNVIVVDILRAAVEEVGAENFNGQAFYDAALKWSHTYDGFGQWTYADGKRYAMRHGKIYEFDAQLHKMVVLTDWIPVIED